METPLEQKPQEKEGGGGETRGKAMDIRNEVEVYVHLREEGG